MTSMETKAVSRRFEAVPLLLALVALPLFCFNLGFPKTVNFDEFHYIPSAKQFLALTENQNYEHPPLGKELIAVGVDLMGDHPWGWRIMSVLFGVITLLGMHRLALAVFRSREAALFVGVLTLFNQLLFVQSRIAMLDTFMMAFLAWSWALAVEGWREGSKSRLRLSGLLMGLACATKWFALIPWATMLAVGGWQVYRVQAARALTGRKKKNALAFPDLRELLISWAAIPVAAYYATFIPFFWVTPKAGGSYGLWEILFTMQWQMWDGQMRVVSSHPYASRWWEWPTMIRPMWYAFDREGSPTTAVRGVMMLGSPVVMWGGLAAVIFTAWDAIQNRSAEARLIAGAWAVCTFSWMVIPRKIAFFYYYYPAAMILGLACSHAIDRISAKKNLTPWIPRAAVLVVTIALFAYFFPILAALPIGPEEFRKWMWMDRWV